MARFSSGWIKLHRDVLDSDISKNIYLFVLWIRLLGMANYKESKIIWKGAQRVLPPGAVVLGIREMAAYLNCSHMTVRKYLDYLRDTSRIVYENCTRGTLVTICNWELYQNGETEELKPNLNGTYTELKPNLNQTETELKPNLNQATLSKESKNVRREEGKKKEGKNSNLGIRAEYPPEFDEVWVLYGRKGDKRAAYGEFKNLNLQQGDIENLTKAIGNCHRRQTDPKYRKDFERYLKTDWREDLTPTSTSNHIHPKTQERLDVYNRFLEREDLRSAEAAKEVSNET